MTEHDSTRAATLLGGRTALVTGAAGAIGCAIAESLAKYGADVVLADIDCGLATKASEAIAGRFGVRSLALPMDVTDTNSVTACRDRLRDAQLLPDVIIPNAGILLIEKYENITEERWDRLMAVNLRGSFYTASIFSQALREERRPGSVIFTSSLFGLRGARGNSAYSASKFGIIGVMQSMALELATDGIRVNAVCPGQIETPMLDKLFDTSGQDEARKGVITKTGFESRIPLGRLGSVNEVADAFVFLASDLSSYVTGQAIIVDGGWAIS